MISNVNNVNSGSNVNNLNSVNNLQAVYTLNFIATSISDGIFFNCAKAGCAHSGGEKKRVIVIFLTFDRALLQNSPCTIVIGRISSRKTFFSRIV